MASLEGGCVVIPGGSAVDDRGQLSFHNEFALRGYERFYLVENHRQGFVRAWHGHKREAKAVTVMRGAALVCAVRIDDWDRPSAAQPVERFVLSANKPSILTIPAGFANGFMTLSDDALLCFFSTATLQESSGDDFRFHARHWDPWHVEER